jgi:nitroreductase
MGDKAVYFLYNVGKRLGSQCIFMESPQTKQEESNMTNETIQTLLTRRSVRSFRKDPVPGPVLDAILEVGTYAPCSMGAQATCLVAVTHGETLQKLSKMNARVLGKDDDPFYGAPAAIIVFSDRDRAPCREDGALVMGNLMNAAHALGLASCWIHRAREVFDSPEGRAMAKDWGVPDNYVGVGHCILGYAQGEYPNPKPRKDGFIFSVK